MSFPLIFDVLAACMLAFFIVRGVLRGFLAELFGLIGFGVSLFCSWTLAPVAAEYVLQYFPTWDTTLTGLGCSVAIFILVSLLFAGLAELLSLLAAAANLSLTDHCLGLLLGLAKTFCILLFVYGAFVMFPILPTAWMKDSWAMKSAAWAWPPVVKFLEEHDMLELEQIREGALNRGDSEPSEPAPASQDADTAILAVPVPGDAPRTAN